MKYLHEDSKVERLQTNLCFDLAFYGPQLGLQICKALAFGFAAFFVNPIFQSMLLVESEDAAWPWASVGPLSAWLGLYWQCFSLTHPYQQLCCWWQLYSIHMLLCIDASNCRCLVLKGLGLFQVFILVFMYLHQVLKAWFMALVSLICCLKIGLLHSDLLWTHILFCAGGRRAQALRHIP